MGQHIKKCPVCGNYSLKDMCLECNSETINPKPARFSLEDRYGKYRRLLRTQAKESKSK